MSKPTFTPPRSEAGDALAAILEGAARFLLWGGLLAAIVGLGFLIFTYTAFAGGTAANQAQALGNIELLQKLLLAGSVAIVVGTSYLFWGEETLGILQLIGSAALFFAPLYLPQLFSGGTPPERVGQQALASIQLAGIVCGAIAIVVTLADVLQRVSTRSKIGSKADQLKYGKGIKEEADIQNVFMGKCWQLPFCRKFVRERCPIYHARRCCWREQVGCMCEESVIREAMAGRTIPKDAVAAAKLIPLNNQLTVLQKHERCRQCVIFNEHQKHKYKLAIPLILLAFGGLYALFRMPMLASMDRLLQNLDRMIGRVTLQPGASRVVEQGTGGLPFQEILLVCIVVVVFTYTLKVLEFLIFKAKV